MSPFDGKNDCTLRLVNVEYQADKRRILATFLSDKGLENRAFPFFPSIRMPRHPDSIALIRQSGIRGLKIETSSRQLHVIAPTFESLVELSQKQGFGNVLLFSPERLFLLQKNWRIGDVLNAEFEPAIKNPFIPAPGFEWPYSPLSTWKAFVLQVPVGQLPPNAFSEFELWLANRFFERDLAIPPAQSRSMPPKNPWRSLDWSRVWKIAFQSGLNPGFESINCDCCCTSETGLLPSSLARFTFHSDGVFFVSQFEWFSRWFHETQPGAPARERFRQEQHLPMAPSGPFYRSMQTILPLADAQTLVEDGLGEIESIPEPHHWCKKPSFLVEHVSHYEQLQRAFVRRLMDIETDAFQQGQLAGFSSLETNLEYRRLSRFVETGEEWFAGLFAHLLEPSSRFYSHELASALSSHYELWWPHWKNTVTPHSTVAFHQLPAEIAQICERSRPQQPAFSLA